jgi:hypothetical protein
MDKFIIDRSQWRTGADSNYATGKGDTNLVNEQGFMCCLGFYCLQAGVAQPAITGVGLPEDLDTEVIKAYNNTDLALLIREEENYYGDIIIRNSKLADNAVDINDSTDYSPQVKEEKLKALFNENGIEIEFINDYTIYNEENT